MKEIWESVFATQDKVNKTEGIFPGGYTSIDVWRLFSPEALRSIFITHILRDTIQTNIRTNHELS